MAPSPAFQVGPPRHPRPHRLTTLSNNQNQAPITYDASEGGFDPWRNYGWHQSSDAWSNSWRTAQPYEEDEPWTQQTTELLPDYLQGWYLLHDAGLDSHERNLIQTAVGSDFSTIRIAQELRALKTNSSSEIKPTSTPVSGIKMKDPVEKTPKDTKDGPQPHWPMKA